VDQPVTDYDKFVTDGVAWSVGLSVWPLTVYFLSALLANSVQWRFTNFVCICICIRLSQSSALQKWLNQSRDVWGTDSDGPKESLGTTDAADDVAVCLARWFGRCSSEVTKQWIITALLKLSPRVNNLPLLLETVSRESVESCRWIVWSRFWKMLYLYIQHSGFWKCYTCVLNILAAEIRRGKKRKKEETSWQYNGLPYYIGQP